VESGVEVLVRNIFQKLLCVLSNPGRGDVQQPRIEVLL
jgi:hypothetical protein